MNRPSERKPILVAENLRKSYPIGRSALGRVTSRFHAVDGVSLELYPGETLAIVGESGAGKSTVGRMLLRLIEPESGSVHLEGDDLLSLSGRQLRERRAEMQMIFQDPYSSLDPKMTIADSVGELLWLHRRLRGRERGERVVELLARVGIREEQMDRYPYELSGGQLQRVAVARAIATEPKIVICDEPVAALDVSIRAQVINLLRGLQAERGMAYAFISHDLSLVRSIAHRVMVMYAGRVVEEGPAEELFADPKHPYTRMLLSAIPEPDPTLRHLQDLDVPTVREEHDGTWTGCAFYRRCPEAVGEICGSVTPPRTTQGGVEVACHLHQADRVPVVDLITRARR